ncbi:MAG: ATP-dependent protease ATPase subunit HslU [Phycisphaerae bacterium]|nr:MAG: ATP-dependent protease ATPase subunit HslU [Phycisphaerae bacterium]
MLSLTPKQIVSELDKYIVGQSAAKRAVAVAVRNRWRRQQLPETLARDVAPKNILMAGPTGVGKTEIARRLASLTGAPFVKVEATKFTEVGYHGRDVESMVRDLLEVAIAQQRSELFEQVKEEGTRAVEERLLDQLLPIVPRLTDDPEEQTRRTRNREKMLEQLRRGELEDREIEISTEEKPNVAGMFGAAGMDLDPDMTSMFERLMPTHRSTKRYTVREARQILFQIEAEKLVDRDRIIRTAIHKTEQSGIIFIDEIDKIAGAEKTQGPDVSRQGVQRDLLPIVEGSTVTTKYGPVKTDHILFIAAGAFSSAKPSDLMPELQGRFPIRVELQDLEKEDFVRILTEPQNALTTQQIELMKAENVTIRFTDEAIDAIAGFAFEQNKKIENIGARRLYTIMEKVFEQISFDAPELSGQTITITASYVKQRLNEVDDKKGWFSF